MTGKTIEDKLTMLGELTRDLPPIERDEFAKHDFPPVGAGRFTGESEDTFSWKPISTEEWRAMNATDRGNVLVDRGKAWITANAQAMVFPVQLEDEEAEQVRRMFADSAPWLHKLICATSDQMVRRPIATSVTTMAVGKILFAATGLPPTLAAGEATRLIIEIYSHFYCTESDAASGL